MTEFMAEMMRHLPRDARLMLCQFRGDPGADQRGKWRARVIDDVGLIDQQANVYLCVSAMRKNARGEYRRRKENFAGGLLLMIDDLGSGTAAKFPLSTIDVLKPTALVETSRGNFQAIYMFDRLAEDMRLFDALIRSFIEAQFLGSDTGMAGVNRVFRPPCGVNGKPKHDGWRVRCVDWLPANRYSPERIAEAFNLTLRLAGPRVPRGATQDKAANIRHFVQVRAVLRSVGMLKREEPDVAGWQDIQCPWMDDHTGGVNNGAGIRLPDAENMWHGAFKCHHATCAERGWRELTQWLSEAEADILDGVNSHARAFTDYAVPQNDR